MVRWFVGDVRITPVLELVWTLDENKLIPEATPSLLQSHSGWLHPDHITEDGKMRLFIQSFVVESHGAVILVDACVGNEKIRGNATFDRLQTPWLQDLEDAGFPRTSVNMVLCTHLHFDHVGWNTFLEEGCWIPTFPNARHLIHSLEWEETQHQTYPHLEDSVRPLFRAGLVDLVSSNHALTPEVSMFPTPGHTIGHVSVLISSRGEQAVITGDAIHHPSQCAHPDWKCAADSIPMQAAQTRKDLLEEYGDTPTRIIGTHFASPTIGKFVRDGDVWKFIS